MSRPKTTHAYITEYKDRLRTAFGEFEGVASKAPDDRDEEEYDDKKAAVDGILAETTPSDLDEEPPADKEEPAPEPEPAPADDNSQE